MKVNTVGFLAPTTLDLDLDTTGANGGTCRVIATNPDGQAAGASVLRTTKYRPDGLIRSLRSVPYIGNDVYNLTGKRQTTVAKRPAGSTRTFYIREQNDGNVPDRLLLKGPGIRPGFRVPYFLGHTDVTAKLVNGPYRTDIMGPGTRLTLRMFVTVASGTLVGSVRSWLISASSSHDGSKRDAVKAIVKVVAG